MEHVDPLGHHDVAVGGDVVDPKLDLLHTTGEAFDRGPDGVDTLDGIDGDVVVHGVVGEERHQRIEVVVRPRGAELLDDLGGAVAHELPPCRPARYWSCHSLGGGSEGLGPAPKNRGSSAASSSAVHPWS